MLHQHPFLLLCIGVLIVAILFPSVISEVQSRLLCVINPGEVHTLKMELNACENSKGQLEVEVMDLKKEKIMCDLKGDPREKIHQKEIEIVALKKENIIKLLHSQLYSERIKNKKLTAEKRELQLDYDALESHCSKEKVDNLKARLEESNKYNFGLLVVVLAVAFGCFCCVPWGNADRPMIMKMTRAIAN